MNAFIFLTSSGVFQRNQGHEYNRKHPNTHYHYEKKVMVNNSTNINNTSSHISPQTKTTTHMTLEISIFQLETGTIMWCVLHAYLYSGSLCGLGLGLWCLTPLSTMLQLCRGDHFIDGGNRSTRRKQQTCFKSLRNFII